MVAFTPHQFAAKWRTSTHKEMSAYVSHFEDLCGLVGNPTPTDVDPNGSFFCYQKANLKESGQLGFADVWYDLRFGWEYVGKWGDLEEKYKGSKRDARSFHYFHDNGHLLSCPTRPAKRSSAQFAGRVEEIP